MILTELRFSYYHLRQPQKQYMASAFEGIRGKTEAEGLSIICMVLRYVKAQIEKGCANMSVANGE